MKMKQKFEIFETRGLSIFFTLNSLIDNLRKNFLYAFKVRCSDINETRWNMKGNDNLKNASITIIKFLFFILENTFQEIASRFSRSHLKLENMRYCTIKN